MLKIADIPAAVHHIKWTKPTKTWRKEFWLDGSASITASELQREWPGWTEDMRTDFCQSSCWLHEQADFPEMLRFIMQHGGPEHWSGIALSVASRLPRDEAFDSWLK